MSEADTHELAQIVFRLAACDPCGGRGLIGSPPKFDPCPYCEGRGSDRLSKQDMDFLRGMLP